MFTNAKALVFIASCALLAQAQSSTGSAAASQTSLPAGLDQCIISCSTQAAAATDCVTFTNLTCVCTSASFQAAAGACLLANCTQSDIQAAQQVQAQQCAAVSSSSSSTAASTSASTSSTTRPSSTAASTSTSTSSTTQSATRSSAAMALGSPFSLGGLLGTLVASAGALVGAAFVL